MNHRKTNAASAWAILLMLFLVTAASCTTAASLPGQIELSAAEFDLGTIPNTEPVTQVFQVRNTGQGDLEIAGVSTSCGCTTAEVSSRRLGPGEAADLAVTYDPQVHDGETGEFMRVVYVRSNDPDTPEANLTIRVKVVDSGKDSGGLSGVSTNVADLYKAFVCPCCGQDIGSCTCGMAEERRALIDQHIASGVSEDQIYRVMFQVYGAGAFFNQELVEQVQADLLAELPAERPQLAIEPLLMNLGTVPIASGPVSATFTVRNAGQSELAITGLLTTCGCTTVVLETAQGTSPVFGANLSENPNDWSAVLASGEQALLVATFDPMFHGPEGTGTFRRGLSVASNDPLNPRLDLSFAVEVVE